MNRDISARLEVIRTLVTENLAREMVPFPVNRKLCSSWTHDLPRGGETILYTSYMYQLAAVFKTYEKLIPRLTSFSNISRIASLGKYLIRPSKEDLERSSLILNNIVQMLKRHGLSFGYLYDEEPYSGALLLELGLLDEFREYGQKLEQFFAARRIKKLITVDPHTANALVRLKKMSILHTEVMSYLEFIKQVNGSGEYVLHDSCLYSRHLGKREAIRNVIANSGIVLKEDPLVTASETALCCGGPLGPVDVELSDSVSAIRSRQLSRLGVPVLVACPLCYSNLSAHLTRVYDIMEVMR
jgi:Fe-S oxidoreductase